MSLLDALLLEEPTPPTTPTLREIFIALRNDGARGSGTINDPFDGGTRAGLSRSAICDFDPKEFIGVCGTPHGFVDDNTVMISGVIGPNASSYNGLRTIKKIDDYAFKVILAAAPSFQPDPSGGSIKANNLDVTLYWPVLRIEIGAANHGFGQYDVVRVSTTPTSFLNGDFIVATFGDDYFWCFLGTTTQTLSPVSTSCTCAKVIYRFDEIMRDIPPFAAVRLGTGVFETRGGSDIVSDPDRVGWNAEKGQKIVGSGMDLTVLRLMPAIRRALVIAHGEFLDNFAVSDLTFDCNMRAQKDDFVMKGALTASGAHIRIARARALDFGTHTSAECFVFGGHNIVEMENSHPIVAYKLGSFRSFGNVKPDGSPVRAFNDSVQPFQKYADPMEDTLFVTL